MGILPLRFFRELAQDDRATFSCKGNSMARNAGTRASGLKLRP